MPRDDCYNLVHNTYFSQQNLRHHSISIPTMAPRIFITGVTGYIGGQTLSTLVSKHPSFSIVGLVRRDEQRQQILAKHPSIEIVIGDLDSKDILIEQSKQADVVLSMCYNSFEQSTANRPQTPQTPTTSAPSPPSSPASRQARKETTSTFLAQQASSTTVSATANSRQRSGMMSMIFEQSRHSRSLSCTSAPTNSYSD